MVTKKVNPNGVLALQYTARKVEDVQTQTFLAGADPGFFLGEGALVSCSTSTPINHIVFFCRIPVVLENRRSSQGGGGGVRTPCTLLLDPPLRGTSAWDASIKVEHFSRETKVY